MVDDVWSDEETRVGYKALSAMRDAYVGKLKRCYTDGLSLDFDSLVRANRLELLIKYDSFYETSDSDS